MRLPLSTLEVFDAIVKEGSMAAAARTLGIKRSTVSHQLKNLEAAIGVSLFVRTTRSISLTQAGHVLARTSGPAFEQLANGLENARIEGHTARGVLKIAVPELAYHLILKKHLASFQALYPEINVELCMTDALSDILKEGLHAGFRLGSLIAQDMVTIKLSEPLTSCVLASEAYLETKGAPSHPKELLSHNCLHYRYQSSGQLAPWLFSGDEGEFPVMANGNFVSNSLPSIIDMAIQGLGVAYCIRQYCDDYIAQNKLKVLLCDYQVTLPNLHIYFPQEYRSMIPLRLFIEHIKDKNKLNK